MDNLEDPTNRIDNEASTSSNDPSYSSKKRKLSDDENGSMKQEIIKQQKIIFDQASTICELHEERGMLKNVKDELERMKKMTEAELVKLKSDMNDQISLLKKENEEKNKKIKEFKLLAKGIKPDPEYINEKEVKIKELELICDSREKKIFALEAQLQSNANTEISQMQQNQSDQTNLLHDENNRLKVAVEKHEKKGSEMEKMLEAKQNIITGLQFRLEEMEKCYKTDLKKNEEDKKALKDENDKKMANMKAEMQGKIDNVTKEHKAAINRVNATNSELLKNISENQEVAADYQNKIKEFNDKITVAKKFNIELYSQNEELKQKELNARAEIIDREKQIQVLQNNLAELQKEPTRSIDDVDEFCDVEDRSPSVLGESAERQAESSENEPAHTAVYGGKNSQFPDWMKKVVSRRFPYIAQIGDKVVYFPQGHLDYIEKCKKQKTLNNDNVDRELKAQEFGIIEKIEYKMSPYRSQLLTLALTDRNYVRTNKRIKLFHHDLINIPDFIVLRQFYDSSGRHDFKEGDEVEAIIDEKWWTGTVQERYFESQGDFHGSQLNSVVVKWDNETSNEKLSPWELQPLTPGRRNATTATSKDHELFYAYTVEMESWPLPPGGPTVGRNAELSREYFFNKMINAIQELNTLPLLSPFQQPVNLQQFPAYAEVVVYPIDLHTINERILYKYYRSLFHLKKDIQMIAVNATKFNERSSKIAIDSKRLVQTLFHILDTVTPPNASEYFHSLEEMPPSELTSFGQDLSLCKSTKRRDHRSASSTTHARGESVNIKDVWMNECRKVCDQIFNEQAKKLLQENGEEESINEILKKFEEQGYNSPDELRSALTEVIQRSLNNCDRKFAKNRSLNTLNQSLDNKLKPIMAKYTRMANGRTNIRQQRSLDSSSAMNGIEPNTVISSPSSEVEIDSDVEVVHDYEEKASVNCSMSSRPRKKDTRKRRQISSDSATSRSSEENIRRSSRKRKTKASPETPPRTDDSEEDEDEPVYQTPTMTRSGRKVQRKNY